MSLLPAPKTAEGHELPWRGYRLSEVMHALQAIASDDMDVWTWIRNNRCKYVETRIDTRDGGYVQFFDRDGKAIRLEDLTYQYRHAEERP